MLYDRRKPGFLITICQNFDSNQGYQNHKCRENLFKLLHFGIKLN